VRLFGALLLVGGGAGTMWSVVTFSTRRRPLDLVAALTAPVALLVALTGGVLVLVPDFLR
jgi:hypothetical protein